jgi:CBS domain-containing protein
MTTDIVAIDRITPFKQIAWLLVQHQINGVPVLSLGRRVAGVVTEGDLIAAGDKHAGERRRWTGTPRYGTDRSRYERLTGEHLMTTPAITIHPDTAIAGAARLMTEHHIKLLPVVNEDSKIVGVVSRRDLLNVYLVPDSEIARQVRELLNEAVPGEPDAITVDVHCGIVTLTGQPEPELRNQAAEAIDLAWDVDGVLDIIDHVVSPQPADARLPQRRPAGASCRPRPGPPRHAAAVGHYPDEAAGNHQQHSQGDRGHEGAGRLPLDGLGSGKRRMRNLASRGHPDGHPLTLPGIEVDGDQAASLRAVWHPPACSHPGVEGPVIRDQPGIGALLQDSRPGEPVSLGPLLRRGRSASDLHGEDGQQWRGDNENNDQAGNHRRLKPVDMPT